MARVSYFIHALDTGKDPENKLIVRAPLNIIRPPFIPSTYSFSIVFSIMDIDPREKHHIRIIFKSPSGKKVFESDFETPVRKMTEEVPVEYIGFTANIKLQNIPLEEEGHFESILIFNEERLGKYPIPVIKMKSGE